MNNEIHWLLISLNNYLHTIDCIEDENLEWRKHFLKQKNVHEIDKNYFLNESTFLFKEKKFDFEKILKEIQLNELKKNECDH